MVHRPWTSIGPRACRGAVAEPAEVRSPSLSRGGCWACRSTKKTCQFLDRFSI